MQLPFLSLAIRASQTRYSPLLSKHRCEAKKNRSTPTVSTNRRLPPPSKKNSRRSKTEGSLQSTPSNRQVTSDSIPPTEMFPTDRYVVPALQSPADVSQRQGVSFSSSRQMGIYFPPMASPVNKASPGATPVKSTRREGRVV